MFETIAVQWIKGYRVKNPQMWVGNTVEDWKFCIVFDRGNLQAMVTTLKDGHPADGLQVVNVQLELFRDRLKLSDQEMVEALEKLGWTFPSISGRPATVVLGHD